MKRWCAVLMTVVVLTAGGSPSASGALVPTEAVPGPEAPSVAVPTEAVPGPEAPASAEATSLASLQNPVATASLGSSVVDGKTYFKDRFSDRIYRIVVDSRGDWVGAREDVTYAQWQAAGFPTPKNFEPKYVKFAWSPKIYPVFFWPDRNRNQGELIGATGEPLTFAQWTSAGAPTPHGGAGYCTWGTACKITQYATSTELFFTVFGPEQHKLTFAEWQMLGAPPVTDRGPGIYKLSWSDRIFWTDPGHIGPRVPNYSNVFSTGSSFTFAFWQQLGTPTPRIVESTKWDRFFVLTGSRDYSPQVYFDGVAGCFTVDAAMWARAGRPQPLALPYGGFPTSRDWCV